MLCPSRDFIFVYVCWRLNMNDLDLDNHKSLVVVDD